MEKRRALWGPRDKPLRKSERADWNSQFSNPDLPSPTEAEENARTALLEEKQAPVREIYDAIQLHPGRLFPAPGKPPDYYLMKKDGHRLILTGMRTRFDYDDEQLHERLKNEEDAKIVTCKNPSCNNEIVLAVKVWTDSESLKTMGSLIHCCPKCLTTVIGAPRRFKNGRIAC